MLVNTSFNVRGEPIVSILEDAFRCFIGTEIKALAIGNCFLQKEAQDPGLCLDYQGEVRPRLAIVQRLGRTSTVAAFFTAEKVISRPLSRVS